MTDRWSRQKAKVLSTKFLIPVPNSVTHCLSQVIPLLLLSFPPKKKGGLYFTRLYWVHTCSEIHLSYHRAACFCLTLERRWCYLYTCTHSNIIQVIDHTEGGRKAQVQGEKCSGCLHSDHRHSIISPRLQLPSPSLSGLESTTKIMLVYIQDLSSPPQSLPPFLKSLQSSSKHMYYTFFASIQAILNIYIKLVRTENQLCGPVLNTA